jgi:hypothetical protein
MNNTLNSAIDNVSTVFGVMTDTLQNYTIKMLNDVKNAKPDIIPNVEPVLGYQDGNQGWYDTLGGGPCNKYCRYTGLSPNIQWTCSDESNLSKLVPMPKNKTGIYCYPYDKKGKKSIKTGVVVDGTFISTESKEEKNMDNGDYNFIIYKNKNPSGLEYFESNKCSNNTNDYNSILLFFVLVFIIHIILSNIKKPQ